MLTSAMDKRMRSSVKLGYLDYLVTLSSAGIHITNAKYTNIISWRANIGHA